MTSTRVLYGVYSSSMGVAFVKHRIRLAAGGAWACGDRGGTKGGRNDGGKEAEAPAEERQGGTARASRALTAFSDLPPLSYRLFFSSRRPDVCTTRSA